jgi:hypothetical protein
MHKVIDYQHSEHQHCVEDVLRPFMLADGTVVPLRILDHSVDRSNQDEYAGHIHSFWLAGTETEYELRRLTDQHMFLPYGKDRCGLRGWLGADPAVENGSHYQEEPEKQHLHNHTTNNDVRAIAHRVCSFASHDATT